MPNAIIQSFANKSGKSEKEVEALWNEIEKDVKKQYPDKSDGDFYAILVSILKKRLDIQNEAASDILAKKAEMDAKKFLNAEIKQLKTRLMQSKDPLEKNATMSKIKLYQQKLKEPMVQPVVEADITNDSKLFNVDNLKDVVKGLEQGLTVPYKAFRYSTLGGNENVSIIIQLSLEPKDKWQNGIFHNSPYVILHLENDGTLYSTSGGREWGKFRKRRFKSIDDIVKYINSLSVKNEDAAITTASIGPGAYHSAKVMPTVSRVGDFQSDVDWGKSKSGSPSKSKKYKLYVDSKIKGE